MAKFSERKISKVSRDKIWNEFCDLIARLKNGSEVRYFLSDLLNRQERIMLARRLHVAALLEAGATYDEIKETLHVGKHTISRVHRWLEFGRDGYRRVVKLLSRKNPHDLKSELKNLYRL